MQQPTRYGAMPIHYPALAACGVAALSVIPGIRGLAAWPIPVVNMG